MMLRTRKIIMMNSLIERIYFAASIGILVYFSYDQVIFGQGDQIDEQEVHLILNRYDQQCTLKDQILDPGRCGDYPILPSHPKCDKDYVLSNINRIEILSWISDWEDDHKLTLSSLAKTETFVEYLCAEVYTLVTWWQSPSIDEFKKVMKEFWKKVMIEYLDNISREPLREGNFYAIFERRFTRSPRLGPFPSRYRLSYGRLKIISIPDKAEVYIRREDKFLNYSDEEFIVPIGDQSIWLKKKGYKDFTDTIRIESGKKHILECNLVTE